MKDWHDRLLEMDRRLAEWNERYAAELAALRGTGLSRLLMRRRREELEAQAAEAARRAGPGPHAEVSSFLDELASTFLEASVAERAKIRAAMGASRALFEALWSWIDAGVGLVQGPAAERRLELVLAGLAIDDLRADIEDVWDVLARAWIAAVRAGLDPAPVFRRVAALANRSAAGGGAHMREVLEGFEHDPQFAARVAPVLEDRRRAG